MPSKRPDKKVSLWAFRPVRPWQPWPKHYPKPPKAAVSLLFATIRASGICPSKGCFKNKPNKNKVPLVKRVALLVLPKFSILAVRERSPDRNFCKAKNNFTFSFTEVCCSWLFVNGFRPELLQSKNNFTFSFTEVCCLWLFVNGLPDRNFCKAKNNFTFSFTEVCCLWLFVNGFQTGTFAKQKQLHF